MYAGCVACCPLVIHGKYTDGTDRQTDADRYIVLSARRGQRYKRLLVSVCASIGDGAGATVCRVESALQQNEIMDVFFDDWAALTIDDGSFGSKADNHLKVCSDCVPICSVKYYSVLIC